MGSNSTLNLNGRVEKTDIPTLIRSVEKDKLTGELSFTRSNDRIDLYFLFGQLYHAKWREVTGLDAVNQLLGWKSGNYIFTEGIIPAQASINDDIERILSENLPAATAKTPTPRPAANPRSRTAATSPLQAVEPPPAPGMEAAAFDLGAIAPLRQPAPQLPNDEPTMRPRPQVGQDVDTVMGGDATIVNERIAPAPPAEGYYRTRYFCLPAGEQMATSLVATGPQLEEELMHLAEVSFTGYVLGSPEVEGYPAAGICLFGGRFIHAFVHGNGGQMAEGERAYRLILDQRGSQSTRFYWFYELASEAMRSAISLLTPPNRYVHLEARIIRFREMMQILTDEQHSGCLKITVPPANSQNSQSSPLAGGCAYLPIFQGKVMGIWTETNPHLANDGPLLQRFLAEPQAFIDLHTTAPVAEPGLPLENLVSSRGTTTLEAIPLSTTTTVSPAHQTDNLPPLSASSAAAKNIDDDDRQLQMITSIARMESTWTQMQLKDKLDEHTKLLALAGFANEVLSLNETVSGPRSVQEMINRGLRQELASFRTIFQLLDLPNGRINIIKLLKEYELFNRDSDKSGTDFYREAGRALRTLIRSSFQYYVSLIRQEHVRFECQEMYEVFLQEIVKKM